ncbi:hypothetical protein HS5_08390 [Acidianus sp. HS-5]|nr:hypothetical protein HS5_08390 [Acidianus sp. HS-5]
MKVNIRLPPTDEIDATEESRPIFLTLSKSSFQFVATNAVKPGENNPLIPVALPVIPARIKEVANNRKLVGVNASKITPTVDIPSAIIRDFLYPRLSPKNPKVRERNAVKPTTAENTKPITRGE